MTIKMNKANRTEVLALALMAVLTLAACSPAGDESPGHEYMPDMFHSTAYEANLYDYYYYNTWGTEDEYKRYALPRTPVKGTIPRGYAGLMNHDASDLEEHFESMPVNGYVPYYYEDTEEERTRATAEITTNPFPITAGGLDRGEELYDIYCGICHGENGDGEGYLLRSDGGVYPAQPANFLLPDFISASEGRYYHALIYGKNVMGGYADKLSYEERWQVIHYIRSLQAKEAGLQYDENGNTLNPGATTVAMNEETENDEAMMEAAPEDQEAESHH